MNITRYFIRSQLIMVVNLKVILLSRLYKMDFPIGRDKSVCEM